MGKVAGGGPKVKTATELADARNFGQFVSKIDILTAKLDNFVVAQQRGPPPAGKPKRVQTHNVKGHTAKASPNPIHTPTPRRPQIMLVPAHVGVAFKITPVRVDSKEFEDFTHHSKYAVLDGCDLSLTMSTYASKLVKMMDELPVVGAPTLTTYNAPADYALTAFKGDSLPVGADGKKYIQVFGNNKKFVEDASSTDMKVSFRAAALDCSRNGRT